LNLARLKAWASKEDAVGLAINEFYERNVPEENEGPKLDELAQKVKSGEIQVPSALEMGPDAVKELRDSVASVSVGGARGMSPCPVWPSLKRMRWMA